MTQMLELVGNTPLIQITYPKSDKIQIFSKCEWFNPSGSVKDRAAANMIQEALKNGNLDGKVLIDATSGNTGIAYAMFGASLGVPIELALPENATEERKLILQNYGVNLHLTSAMEGTDGAQRFVKQLVEENPEKYFYPDQYNNDANWQAHYKGTGPEIWRQTDGKVTHFVAGLGTTGTFVGTSRFLQEKGVFCVSVQPDNPMHGLEGWKHMETAIVPGIYDDTVENATLTADTEVAFKFAKAASKELGLMLSPSAGANLASAYELAETIGSGVIVTTFADNGMKYLNDGFWRESEYEIETPFA